ncbi:MAG: type I-E CRISPR-associated protein Cas5/CasD [Candidatus Ornithospirochaeta sp.]
MRYLALWFEAPLQSWGVESKFSLRNTFEFPTKSGIAGIILSSLGRGGEEREFLSHFSSFNETAISFVPKEEKEHLSQVLTDFQVVGNGYDESDPWELNMIPKKRDGGKAVRGGAKLTFRHYLQDAHFGVIQEVDEVLADEISSGLSNPIWPLYLGRRCCIPSFPIFQGLFETKEDASNKIFEIASSKELIEKERLVDGADENAFDSFYLMDVSVSFGKQKKYRDRLVSIVRL